MSFGPKLLLNAAVRPAFTGIEEAPLRPGCCAGFALSAGSAANTAGHVEPHRGGWTMFVTGKLQSLCEACHNSTKR